MTPERFGQVLKDLGLSRAALARELHRLTGLTVDESTLWRYAHGASPVPVGLAAYLELRRNIVTLGSSGPAEQP